MNILFLTTHLNAGGITSYLMTLSRGLVKKGHRVLIVSSGGQLGQELDSSGIKHITINIRTKSELDFRIYWALGHLNDILRREKIDLIHAQTRITQVMASWLSWMSKIPYVATCHGFFKPRLSRKIFPCWGNRVIAISAPVQEHLIKDFHVEFPQIALIPNGIDLERFPLITALRKQEQRRKFSLGDEPTVGIIARLSEVKGQDILIAAMKKVVGNFPDAKLLIVGEGGWQSKIEELVKSLRLTDNVRFYSIVNQTADMLSLFDVFAMPSRQEGLGLSVMEAQSCGVPVVASKVGGLVSLIDDGRTGLLVPPENPNLLAEAILLLLKNKAKAQEMGLRARDFIQKEFSAQSMVDKTFELYQHTIQQTQKK